jgi:hypothetical protein
MRRAGGVQSGDDSAQPADVGIAGEQLERVVRAEQL